MTNTIDPSNLLPFLILVQIWGCPFLVLSLTKGTLYWPSGNTSGLPPFNEVSIHWRIYFRNNVCSTVPSPNRNDSMGVTLSSFSEKQFVLLGYAAGLLHLAYGNRC